MELGKFSSSNYFCCNKIYYWMGILKIFIGCFISFNYSSNSFNFIPIYFIVRRKAWTRDTYILLGLGVLLAAGFSEFSQLLFSAIEDTQYGHYSEFDEGGASL